MVRVPARHTHSLSDRIIVFLIVWLVKSRFFAIYLNVGNELMRRMNAPIPLSMGGTKEAEKMHTATGGSESSL